MEFVRILGFIWNMYGVIGFVPLSRVLPFVNSWFRFLYELLSPPFYAFYYVVKGFIGPLFLYKMGVFLSEAGDHVIPRWIWVSWIIVVLLAILVSILWISNLWVGLYRERKTKLQESEKKIS